MRREQVGRHETWRGDLGREIRISAQLGRAISGGRSGSRRDLAERAQPVGVEEEQAPVVVRRRVVEAK